MSNIDNFTAGVAQVESLIAAERENASIDPRCVSVLMQHGRRTERVIVLFHGFTNCPRQFAQFGEDLFDAGLNVYIPRLPRHGMRDKLTTELEGLTIEELKQCAGAAVERAAQLASSTSVVGLSVGATMVAWLAQTQPLDLALAIAPFFSVTHVPSLLEPAVAGALASAPNIELWWDPRRKENIGPAHGYPRFPTHALARCLQLGENVRELARTTPAVARRTTLVLNAKDPAIDNAAAREVWQSWRARGTNVDEYLFENLDARHDIIEPQTYSDAAALVYPVLRQLIGS